VLLRRPSPGDLGRAGVLIFTGLKVLVG